MKEQFQADQTGIFYCPNTDCGVKIGKFSHYGEQCSCGKFVCPAYQFHSKKINSTEIEQIVEKIESKVQIEEENKE